MPIHQRDLRGLRDKWSRGCEKSDDRIVGCRLGHLPSVNHTSASSTGRKGRRSPTHSMVRIRPGNRGGLQIESRRWRTASIAARTRDRSALASREKCPCFKAHGQKELTRERPRTTRSAQLETDKKEFPPKLVFVALIGICALNTTAWSVGKLTALLRYERSITTLWCRI